MLAETEMSLRDDRVHFTAAGRGELSAILTRINSDLLPDTEHHHD